MEQIPTTSSGVNATTATLSSAGPSGTQTPIQSSNNDCVDKSLQSVSESNNGQMSGPFASNEEVGLFSLHRLGLCEDSNRALNSTFLETGTDEIDTEQILESSPYTYPTLDDEEWDQGENFGMTLVGACHEGDIDKARQRLKEGYSVHETNTLGESLIALACSEGRYELALFLLENDANIEDRGIKGECTPLMEAAFSGFVEIVRLLKARGADVNALSSTGFTPLMYACVEGHVDTVKELLNHETIIENINTNERTPLMEAANYGHVMVLKLLIEHGAAVNYSNKFRESALTLACFRGHLEAVRYLLDVGADKEHETVDRHTALIEASIDGHVDVVRLLLDSGAQINKPPDGYESALAVAASYGHVVLTQLLIDRDANIEEVDEEGFTPLMEAAREGHKNVVDVLLIKGANINALSRETEETALTLACYDGCLDVADWLIKNGAMLELGAKTPLIIAAEKGHLDLVRYLIACGANIHAQSDKALTLANENYHTDIVDLLLELGGTPQWAEPY